MNLVNFARGLRTHWLAVLALATLGGVAAGLYSASSTPVPVYRSDAQVLISIGDPTVAIGDLDDVEAYLQQRVPTYVRVADSPAVTEGVIRSLDLPHTTDQLARIIDVTAPANASVLTISVTESSPETARDIANAVATEFARFLDATETPAGRSTALLTATITKDASLPTVPLSSSSIQSGVARGILAGLAAGVGFAILRQRYRTVGGRREIVEVTDAAVLGELPDGPKARHRPLTADGPDGDQANEYRRIWANLRSLSVDERLAGLVVTGPGRGDGSSAVATNLAIALARASEAVVLIDGDLRTPQVATRLGVHGDVGLTSVLLGDATVAESLQQWRHDLPLQVIAAGPLPPDPSELLATRRLTEMVAGLTAGGKTVVFAAPPLESGADAAALAQATQGALIVARVGRTRADRLEGAVDELRDADARILGVVATGVGRRTNKRGPGKHDHGAQPSGRQAIRRAKASTVVGVPSQATSPHAGSSAADAAISETV